MKTFQYYPTQHPLSNNAGCKIDLQASESLSYPPRRTMSAIPSGTRLESGLRMRHEIEIDTHKHKRDEGQLF